MLHAPPAGGRVARAVLPGVMTRRSRRFMCTAVAAFEQLMDRGLGVGARLDAEARAIVSCLAVRGWCAVDGLLSAPTSAEVREQLARCYDAGDYQPSYSRVVETGEKLWRPDVHMMELDGESWRAAPHCVLLVHELMGALPAVVNEGFSSELELQGHAPPRLSSRIFGHKLAVSTAAGARYPKHLDNVAGGEDTRKLTAVYYPNAGWDVARQGGAIRLFDALEEPTHVDVAPVGRDGASDRLLLFWSDLLVHEVLPMAVGRGRADEHGQEQVGGSSAPTPEGRLEGHRHHRHTVTVWLTTENDACLCDARSPLWPLRVAHYPDKEE